MKRNAQLLVSLIVTMTLRAQTPAPRDVKITFLPPPTDGTISLGIYDAKGTLVRVLHREADVEEFQTGSDALITHWDGKNDAGEPLPAGRYHARGYAIDADIEGVGYFFNDWVTDENSLRIATITAIDMPNGVPLLSVKLADGRAVALLCDLNANIVNTGEPRSRQDLCDDAISCANGMDRTRWKIVRLTSGETEVQQFSSAGELLRRLSIPPQDPQPQQIAASSDTETIVLLEENGAMQRLRSLTLVTTKEGNSDWKIDFEKKIVAHQNFGVENGKPIAAGGKPASDHIAVKLAPNELKKGARETLPLFVGYDEDGSFLKTADGLPLQSISETQHLTRIVIAPHGEKSADIFQDDGAVVEQFRVTDLDQIAAFDAGEFELK